MTFPCGLQVYARVSGVDSAACEACKFSYLETSPVVSVVSPLIGMPGDIMTLNGTGLCPASHETIVKIGEVECLRASCSVLACPENVTVCNDSSVTCIVPALPMGRHQITVRMPGQGSAGGDFVYTQSVKITQVRTRLQCETARCCSRRHAS